MVQPIRDSVFGIHSVCVLNIADGYKPYKDGLLEVLGDTSGNFAFENVPLNGGSNPFPFAVESGAANSEISLVVRQANRAMFEAFAAAGINDVAASSTGTVGDLNNTLGSTAKSATIGIASVSVLTASAANLKTGLYVIEVMTSTTVNIYATTNIDNLVGTDIEFQDGYNKILASNVSITTGGDTDIASLGIKLTGGSGTIGMTVGDKAIFNVAAAHDGVEQYSVGLIGQTPPYVGLLFVSAKQADGTVVKQFYPKVKLNGMPFNMKEKNFAEFEIAGQAVRTTDPTNTAQEIVYRTDYIRGVNRLSA